MAGKIKGARGRPAMKPPREMSVMPMKSGSHLQQQEKANAYARTRPAQAQG